MHLFKIQLYALFFCAGTSAKKKVKTLTKTEIAKKKVGVDFACSFLFLNLRVTHSAGCLLIFPIFSLARAKEKHPLAKMKQMLPKPKKVKRK